MLNIIIEHIASLLLMLGLLFCSAFFSGSETAFFNLSRREGLYLKNSNNKFARLAFNILVKPKKLLTALLFGNMLVNVFYFAISISISLKVAEEVGTGGGIAFGVVCFTLLVVIGEMLPKSIAYSNSKGFTLFAAVPCYIIMRIFAPIVSFFNLIVIEPAIRLLMPIGTISSKVKMSHIKMLLELSRKRGSITSDQNHLISEVLELSFLKVRHVMKPRVDMVICEADLKTRNAIELMVSNSVKKMPIYEDQIDNITGIVHLKEALLEPNKSLRELAEEAVFVPEQKSIESLLEFFRTKQLDLAIVVDEYGGVAGLITIKDIISELLGPQNKEEAEEMVKQIGPLEYLLSGNLPLHDWAEAFGFEEEQTKFATLGGFITSLLGKIPQRGDMVNLNNMVFTVKEVEKFRIKTLSFKTSFEEITPK